MPRDKKGTEGRIPPWERARIIVHMQEEERKRKLFQGENKNRKVKPTGRARNPSPLDSVLENRKRLSEIRRRMAEGQTDK